MMKHPQATLDLTSTTPDLVKAALVGRHRSHHLGGKVMQDLLGDLLRLMLALVAQGLPPGLARVQVFVELRPVPLARPLLPPLSLVHQRQLLRGRRQQRPARWIEPRSPRQSIRCWTRYSRQFLMLKGKFLYALRAPRTSPFQLPLTARSNWHVLRPKPS